MKKRLQSAFTLIELLVVITIIAILAGIALPVYSTIQERGQQTKALANAKQVALALRLYAGDNSGTYPGGGIDENAAANANEAFRELFPDYVNQEKIFHYKVVPWANEVPDEDTDGAEALSAGENMWAFVTNLSDTSNPSAPLIMDATAQDGQAIWTDDETVQGGVWKGTKAVVVFNDQSGQIVTSGNNNVPRIDEESFTLVDGDGNALTDEVLGEANEIVNPE